MNHSIEQLVLAESGSSFVVVDPLLIVQQLGGRIDILENGDDLLGKHLLDLLPELVGYEPVLADLLAGRQAQLWLPEIGRDGPHGSIRYLNLLTLPYVNDAKQIEGLIQVVTDVTEHGIIEQIRVQQRNELRLLKEQITHQNIGLARMNDELQRATKLKDEFLANMSHEIRTPLTAILGLTEVIQAELIGPINTEQIEALSNIQESGQHLLALINDFLDFAKIESGQFDLDFQVVPVQSICQSSIRIVRELAIRKGITLKLEIHPAIHLIRADERRLMQALINLLSNAIKFTPNDGEIGLEVQGYPELDQIRFTVWDTGIGIAQHDIVRLFKPFSQLEGEYQHTHAGSGLGLVLVAQLIKLHGGGIELTSELGRGSRFTLVLPWSQYEQQRQIEDIGTSTPAFPFVNQHPEDPPLIVQISEPLDILLVEDDQSSAALLANYLGRCGYRVTYARSGEVALAQVQETIPRLIVMDVYLQGMDGLETIRHMRQRVALQRTPIIALTALALPGDRERCLAAGATVYLNKPLKLSQLASITMSLVRR